MAVITNEEFMNRINKLVGEDSSDETLAMLGDFSDTLNANSDAVNRVAELEAENKRIDADWRKKYRDRFFNGGTNDEDFGVDLSEHGGKEKRTFESLFTTGGK